MCLRIPANEMGDHGMHEDEPGSRGPVGGSVANEFYAEGMMEVPRCMEVSFLERELAAGTCERRIAS
jgi:hypothetical protein